MDGVSRQRTADRRRRPPQRTRRPTNRDYGAEGEQRRFIQLMASLALFLLVYIGRGVFPAQLEMWRAAAAANVDFKGAFLQFSSELSRGESVQDALEALCIRLLGGDAEMEPSLSSPPFEDEQNPPLIFLSQTPGGGLGYLNEHGLWVGSGYLPKRDEPEPSQPEPTQPAVVTAMAQEYTDDGVKLPRNVSLAFYELGLTETAVPVAGTATSSFGYRDSPINGKHEFHLALDIGAAEGTEIGAFAAGTVEYIGESDEFGNYLKIRHENNVSSFYAHCSKLLVHKGDQVDCGQTVALVGHTGNATGSHLHLTIEKDNIRLDPAYYVDLS